MSVPPSDEDRIAGEAWCIGTWIDAVVILGVNRPRHVHRAELELTIDGDYRLNWWPTSGDDAEMFTRTVHEVLSVGRTSMRGRHNDLEGDLGVFALRSS